MTTDAKVLISGAQGFVGRYVVEALEQVHAGNAEVIPSSRSGVGLGAGRQVISLDITDRIAVRATLRDLKPTHFINLAAVASPAMAAHQSELTWTVNLQGALNVAEAILENCPNTWMLQIGSGMMYGEDATTTRLADEGDMLAPQDNYSASKAAADIAIGAMVHRGLRCIRLRPFSHTGAGQGANYVGPAFASQIARIEKGLQSPTMQTGNLGSYRDFLDVRDVAYAYALAVKNSDQIESGQIFNISSGDLRPIRDILDVMLNLSTCRIDVTSADKDPLRGVSRIGGTSEPARKILNWRPRYSFEEIFQDLLIHHRQLAGVSDLNRHWPK
jgi:GDP-4-dehydro-6-deoxy-D-mannose reductase